MDLVFNLLFVCSDFNILLKQSTLHFDFIFLTADILAGMVYTKFLAENTQH